MTLTHVAGLSLKAREQELPVARIRIIPPPQLHTVMKTRGKSNQENFLAAQFTRLLT